MPVESRFDQRARPQGPQRLVILICGLMAGVAGCWLTRAVDSSPQPGWVLGVTVGIVLAAMVIGFAMLGTRVVVDELGVLTYSLHGRPNLSFDLPVAVTIRPVRQGIMQGIGIAFADPQAVRFLHKSGVSPERMRRWRDALGVDLVLEGFSAEAAEELRRLQETLRPAGASVVTS